MFKQTTAYELRISDRSSYLCSSDLDHRARRGDIAAAAGTASAGLQAAERGGCARRECSAALLDGSRDRKRVVKGKRVSARVELDGRRRIKKKNTIKRGIERRICATKKYTYKVYQQRTVD